MSSVELVCCSRNVRPYLDVNLFEFIMERQNNLAIDRSSNNNMCKIMRLVQGSSERLRTEWYEFEPIY